MTSRLDDPLGRSWLRRGYQNPTPTWGQSIPDLWAETPVTFTRRVQRLDEYGSFIGDVGALLWTTFCHAELTELSNKPVSDDQVSGPILVREYTLYVSFPGDISLLPANGDYAAIAQPTEQPLSLRIKRVRPPNGLHDHLEIEAVTYE